MGFSHKKLHSTTVFSFLLFTFCFLNLRSMNIKFKFDDFNQKSKKKIESKALEIFQATDDAIKMLNPKKYYRLIDPKEQTFFKQNMHKYSPEVLIGKLHNNLKRKEKFVARMKNEKLKLLKTLNYQIDSLSSEKEKNKKELQKKHDERNLVIQSVNTCDFVDKVIKINKKNIENAPLKKDRVPIDNNFVNTAIFLNYNEKFIKKPTYEIEVIIEKFMQAVEQKVQVVIVSSPVAKPIFDFYNKFNTEKEENDFKESGNKKRLTDFVGILKDRLSKGTLKLFLTKHSKKPLTKEEFVVLVSKKEKETLDLKKLGLNPSYLAPVNIGNISSQIKASSLSKRYIDHLKKIFYSSKNKEEIKNMPRKFIYLIGHGSANEKLYKAKTKGVLQAGSYAGIKLDHFLDLLRFLEKIKSDMFFMTTCYSGGWNSLKMLNEPNSFSLAVSAISDNVSYGANLNFKDFYNNLKELFSTGKPSSNWINNQKLKTALKSVAGNSLNNTPSVCFPGDLFFKVVDVNNNITKINGENDYWKKEKNPSILRIESNQKAIIFYNNVSKKILSGNISQFISMIPGTAHHSLRGINTNLTFEALIKKIIGEEEGLKIISPKMFFIGSVSCRSANNSTVSDLEHHDIRNFYIMTWGNEDDNWNDFVRVAGGFVIKGATKKGIFTNSVSDKWISFTYDTKSKNMRTQIIDKDVYQQNLIEALRVTTPTKEAFLRINDKIKCTIKTPIGTYYAFEKPFLYTVNNYLREEGLELYVVSENDFKTISLDKNLEKKKENSKNKEKPALKIKIRFRKNVPSKKIQKYAIGATILTILGYGIWILL